MRPTPQEATQERERQEDTHVIRTDWPDRHTILATGIFRNNNCNLNDNSGKQTHLPAKS